MKFTFIRDYRRQFPVAAMCRVLEVSKSGFFRWLADPVGKRQKRQEELTAAIQRVRQGRREVYGSIRVHRQLLQEGHQVCRNTVAKVMKQAGIQAKTHRRFKVRTTDSHHDHPIAANLLEREFSVERLNQVWLTDITYVPTDEGFLYLAGVMDLCSRKIIGWSMADHLRAELACDALNMALQARRPGADLLHHSDRGVQYACQEYRQILSGRGIRVSMSGLGNCYDNAPKESFWGKFKTELVYLEHFATRAQARAAIFEWIECFYNRVRLHSSLGYVSPERFEAAMT